MRSTTVLGTTKDKPSGASVSPMTRTVKGEAPSLPFPHVTICVVPVPSAGMRAILIAGPLGSGKTTVATVVGDILDELGESNAVIDLDWLCWAGPHLSGEQLTDIMCDNLASLRTRYFAAGVASLVLCRAVSSVDEVAAIRHAAGGALVAVRLSVPQSEQTRRLQERGNEHDILEAAQSRDRQARLHLPAVRNHGRTARETAEELLRRVSWLP